MRFKLLPYRIPLCTYLIWQSLVTSSQTLYVIALFVNTVFSDEEKILIKNYTSWKDRIPGCSRSLEIHARRQTPGQGMKTQTRWTLWFWVKRISDQPRTHSTVREISRCTGIPKSSVVRIIKKNMQLKRFKIRRAQELTEANCATHIFPEEKTVLSKSL